MGGFFETAFTFPTAIFSALLIPMLLYWLTVMLGAVDLDFFDGLLDGFDGALDGADGGDVGDADGESGSGVLAALGLAGVPLTVSLSLLIFFAWFLTYAGMELFGAWRWGFFGGVWVAALVTAVACGGALLITALAVRPLRPVFATQTAMHRHELVGKVCTVTTQRVDERFGQAELDDAEGATLLLQVRCPESGYFKRGQKALIYDYEVEKEVFWVSPLDKKMAALHSAAAHAKALRTAGKDST